MGIIGLDQAFTPEPDFIRDLERAASEGATVFVPHPTGWWDKVVYPQEAIRILDEVPTPSGIQTPIELTAADRKLTEVVIVADGREICQWNIRGQDCFQKTIDVPESVKHYIRAEVHAHDGRHAYTNPVYFG